MGNSNYPSFTLAQQLTELGLSKSKQQLLPMKNILSTCLHPWAVSNLKDVDEVAEVLIYLTRKNIIVLAEY